MNIFSRKPRRVFASCVVSLGLASAGLPSTSQIAFADEYLIGAGMHDITAPVADMVMMGYVDPSQKTAGISTRLRSRAFIIGDGKDRVAIVTIDQLQVTQVVKQAVMERLRTQYDGLYTEKNVLISATHTHSAPGGLSDFRMYTLSTLGHSKMAFSIVVDGIYESIVKAHQNLKSGRVLLNKGELVEGNITRSPFAYLENPEAERARYKYSTDKDMTLLKFVENNGLEVGVLNWYAVHATSMDVKNQLISGDNKGYSSQMFERQKNSNYFKDKQFVAAFANSNAGDASPKNAAKDLNNDRDWDCTLIDSFKCTKQSGEIQLAKAVELYNSAKDELAGPIDTRHIWVDMGKVEIKPEIAGSDGKFHTCYGAIGLSMLAGAKDHFGVGVEGQRCSTISPALKYLCYMDRDSCHGEKPIVLQTGLQDPPWTPQVLPIQLVRIGQLALIAFPGEFTTMSGRRIREEVQAQLAKAGVTHVVLAGYANAYAGYVSTREEYQLQMYEGASTHFGEWTQKGYQQIAQDLAIAMRDGKDVEDRAIPLDLTTMYKWLETSAKRGVYDSAPLGKALGDVKTQPDAFYKLGDVVSADFFGGYPNNDNMIQKSFLEFQRRETDGWRTVRHDWDFETKFTYRSASNGVAIVGAEWDTTDAEPGQYRIVYRGVANTGPERFVRIEGISKSFVLMGLKSSP